MAIAIFNIAKNAEFINFPCFLRISFFIAGVMLTIISASQPNIVTRHPKFILSYMNDSHLEH